jgi:hypothetical protein
VSDNENNNNLEVLQERHAEMCATVHDMGLEVPEDLLADFDNAEVGSVIVSNLDALIRKHVSERDAGEASNEEESDEGSFEFEAEEIEAAHADAAGEIIPEVAAEAEVKVEEAAPVKKAKKPTVKKEVKVAQVAKPKKTVAKKAPVKTKKIAAKAKTTAKKAAVTKKTAAKSAVTKIAKKNGAPKGIRGLPLDAVITWGVKPNPARPGTKRHARYATVEKSSGKTLKAFLAKGHNTKDLRSCIRRGLCRAA